MNKIPANYHLKKMIKSSDPEVAFNEYVYYVQQNAIQNTFIVQKYINGFFDFTRNMISFSF